MTLQNLSRILDKYESQFGSSGIQQFELLKGLPFYDWSDALDSSVNMFNHAIGLPQKNGQPMPHFDYEKLLFDTLQSNKHVWIKKATGLDVTEFVLRYMSWLCFQQDIARNTQMCIIVGPNIDRAVDLIKRMKGLFLNLGVTFDSKETVIELNGVHIEAYPSHHLDAMRGLPNVSFIFLDEADFFPPGQQQYARDVSERYIAKSNPHIIMVSTPNAPEGLFERIEKESESTCLYKRLLLDYTYGVGKIYTEDEIAQAKASPSFEREYNLKYLGQIGNVFHIKDIEEAKKKGADYQLNTASRYSQKSMGLDPSPGSSGFGICITELVDGIVNVIYADEIPAPDFDQMIETAVSLCNEYNIRLNSGCNIFVDGANPAFIRALKSRLHEDTQYLEQIARWKSENGMIAETVSWLMPNMFVLPTNFSKYHKEMLAHSKEVLELAGGAIAINEGHSKLITSLRTAVEQDGKLDKEATSYDDLFDAFRLSLQRWASN
jgi:hypothetical protein